MTDIELFEIWKKHNAKPPVTVKNAMAAMREAMRRDAEDFFEWTSRHGWVCRGSREDELYYTLTDDETVIIPTSEVYDEFLKTQE